MLTIGWDPVTGWGSIDFTSLSSLLLVPVAYYGDNPSSSNQYLSYFNSLPLFERILIVLLFISILFSIVSFVFRVTRNRNRRKNNLLENQRRQERYLASGQAPQVIVYPNTTVPPYYTDRVILT